MNIEQRMANDKVLDMTDFIILYEQFIIHNPYLVAKLNCSIPNFTDA